jgi:hypothetical protein
VEDHLAASVAGFDRSERGAEVVERVDRRDHRAQIAVGEESC